MTKPYISVSIRFYAKDLPDTYLGLTSENWSFNHRDGTKMDLDRLIAAIALKLTIFYGNTVGFSTGEDVESIEKKMTRAGEAIVGYYLKEMPSA